MIENCRAQKLTYLTLITKAGLVLYPWNQNSKIEASNEEIHSTRRKLLNSLRTTKWTLKPQNISYLITSRNYFAVLLFIGSQHGIRHVQIKSVFTTDYSLLYRDVWDLNIIHVCITLLSILHWAVGMAFLHYFSFCMWYVVLLCRFDSGIEFY